VTVSRKQILERLRKTIADKRPIIGAGASAGLSAEFEEAGGADLIVICNSGRFRMAGRGSMAGYLPYGDANAIVLEMAYEVLPVVKNTPVLAGVCGTDPFRLMHVFLRQIKEVGFSGVQNFPTVGLCDGLFRQKLEETEMGYGLEVDMIRKAHEMDLFTSPYAFNVEEAKAMAEAGADIIVAHLGLTANGSVGARTSISLKEAPQKVQAICDAARNVNPDVILLCHEGPVSLPADVEYVLKNTAGVHGFYGAFSMERIPTEIALKEQVERFKAIRF
jgi:predicted TIM-barrel enzyme